MKGRDHSEDIDADGKIILIRVGAFEPDSSGSWCKSLGSIECGNFLTSRGTKVSREILLFEVSYSFRPCTSIVIVNINLRSLCFSGIPAAVKDFYL